MECALSDVRVQGAEDQRDVGADAVAAPLPCSCCQSLSSRRVRRGLQSCLPEQALESRLTRLGGALTSHNDAQGQARSSG